MNLGRVLEPDSKAVMVRYVSQEESEGEGSRKVVAGSASRNSLLSGREERVGGEEIQSTSKLKVDDPH